MTTPLSPAAKYHCIVCDPPWRYNRKWNNGASASSRAGFKKQSAASSKGTLAMPYPEMTTAQIAALPVADLAAADAHLYLWATNKFLHDAFHVAEAWGFRFGQLLVWAKTPAGKGLGDAFTPTAEFVLFCRRGTLRPRCRIDSTWFNWKRTLVHSKKPEHFLDMVEQVSPGPYLELFSRRHRLGWSVWGNEVESTIALAAD
jgi:N6-adenosine-specific RNA methylase IME4